MSNELPKISVIIPTYNSEVTLERCLDSVVLQTLKPLEILVIDDCSSQQSFQQIKDIVDKFGAIAQLFQLPKNQGPGTARNFGIRQASGEFLAFLDSDDFWLPQHLEINWKVALDIGDSAFAIVHQPLANVPPKLEIEVPQFRRFSLPYYLFIQKNCSTITAFLPTEVARGNLFPERRRFAEDFEFFIKVFSAVRVRAYIIKPRTAVVGKHAWASQHGLSSKQMAMFHGVLLTLIRSTWKTKYAPLLFILIPWHLLKFARRLYYLNSIRSEL